MLKFKYLLPGDCWRFSLDDNSAPDHRATTVSLIPGSPRPADLDSDWDWMVVPGHPKATEYLRLHGERAVELLEHYSTHPSPTPLKLTRGDLKPGDCFQYLESTEVVGPSGPMIACSNGLMPAGMPSAWCPSPPIYTITRNRDLVRRIRHWNATPQYEHVVAHEGVVTTLEMDATDLQDGDIITHVYHRSEAKWMQTGYHATPLTVSERFPDGRAKRMKEEFGATVYFDGTPYWVRVQRKASNPQIAAPVILSGVDPLKDLRDAIFVREEKTTGGIKGRECLQRFEMAQRTESLARPRADVDQLVSTNAECGMTSAQVEVARDLWSYKLRLQIAETKLREETAVRRNVCDDPDEMPNMVFVDGVK